MPVCFWLWDRFSGKTPALPCLDLDERSWWPLSFTFMQFAGSNKHNRALNNLAMVHMPNQAWTRIQYVWRVVFPIATEVVQSSIVRLSKISKVLTSWFLSLQTSQIYSKRTGTFCSARIWTFWWRNNFIFRSNMWWDSFCLKPGLR